MERGIFKSTINRVWLEGGRIYRTQKIILLPVDDLGTLDNSLAAYAVLTNCNARVPVPSDIRREVVDGAAALSYQSIDGTTVASRIEHGSSANEQMAIATEMAHVHKHIHSIPLVTWGFLAGRRYNRWEDYLDFWLNNQSQYILDKQILTPSEIDAVRSVVLPTGSVPRQQPYLTHGDFRLENIIYRPDEGIVGVIDWDNARGADPLFDASYTANRVLRTHPQMRTAYLDTYLHGLGDAERLEAERAIARYQLFFAYKLLPVHAEHTSNPGESVEQLQEEVRLLLGSPLTR